jgi:hypothetical protein
MGTERKQMHISSLLYLFSLSIYIKNRFLKSLITLTHVKREDLAANKPQKTSRALNESDAE